MILVTAPHWLIFLDTLRQAYTVYDYPYANFAIRQHVTGFFLGPLTAGPALTGLNLLALVLLIAAIAAPEKFIPHRPVLACGIVAAALLAIAFGAIPASVLVKIPLIRNIGHIHDTFLTAALPLMLVVAALGAEVLLTAGLFRTSLIAFLAAAASLWLFADVGRYLRARRILAGSRSVARASYRGHSLVFLRPTDESPAECCLTWRSLRRSWRSSCRAAST